MTDDESTDLPATTPAEAALSLRSPKQRLISLVKDPDMRLGGLAQEFKKIDGRELRSSTDGDIVVEALRLEHEYRECLRESVSEFQVLCQQLRSRAFVTLHKIFDRDEALVWVFDPFQQRRYAIAAHPVQYASLKRFFDRLCDYLEHPPENGEAQVLEEDTFETKMKLTSPGRKCAENCCIDDDASLSLLGRMFVLDDGYAAPLDHIVILLSRWIKECWLVLEGDTDHQMESLVRANLYVPSDIKLRLTPEAREWAVHKGIIPPTREMQVAREFEMAASARGSETNLRGTPGKSDAGKRGPKRRYDASFDRRIYVARKAGQPYQEIAREFSTDDRQLDVAWVKKAYNRHRGRLSRME